MVIASHRQCQPDIFEFADIIYREPTDIIEASDTQFSTNSIIPRWQFVLEQTKKNNIKVLFTGRNGIYYEV
ncbi:hypothetical protein [Psychrobacter frigidicola]|uniref:hypothetical protein n=1 Tax=Psychrobacter frigidicola TaxID=45611 RepID=UPI001919D359|nr:hypothetical protein [Psychrobacter frigidicola]